MTAFNVTNNHVGALMVGRVLIRPTATARVEDWGRVSRSNAVKTWIGLGLISAAPTLPPVAPAPDPAREAEPVGDEKDFLIEKLAEVGIERDRRSSVETLRKLVADAGIE